MEHRPLKQRLITIFRPNSCFGIRIRLLEAYRSTLTETVATTSSDGGSPAQNVVFVSNGDGTFTQSSSFNLNIFDYALQSSDGNTAFVVADFTGRGIAEILRVKNTPSTAGEWSRNQLFVKNNSSQPDQLLSVQSPTGAVTTLAYVTLPNSGSALGSLHERP